MYGTLYFGISIETDFSSLFFYWEIKLILSIMKINIKSYINFKLKK